MIVVDSSVWIDNLRNSDAPHVRFLDSVESPSSILVGDVIMLEVLQGARDDNHAARLERHMRQFRVVPFLDEALAVQGAHHYRRLRSFGITIRKTTDLIIATFCIAGGHPLLHSDRDFAPFVKHCGLKLAM